MRKSCAQKAIYLRRTGKSRTASRAFPQAIETAGLILGLARQGLPPAGQQRPQATELAELGGALEPLRLVAGGHRPGGDDAGGGRGRGAAGRGGGGSPEPPFPQKTPPSPPPRAGASPPPAPPATGASTRS